MRLAGTLFLVLAAAAQVRTLQDGTPVRLRLNRTVSSATAHVGETVDFEITEPVINQNYVIIPKGAVALGRVTKVEVKRRFGRAGALELSVDSVRLSDGRSITLRATREKVGVTEIANFAKYEVTGRAAEDFLNRLMTNRMPKTGRIVALLVVVFVVGLLAGRFLLASPSTPAPARAGSRCRQV